MVLRFSFIHIFIYSFIHSFIHLCAGDVIHVTVFCLKWFCLFSFRLCFAWNGFAFFRLNFRLILIFLLSKSDNWQHGDSAVPAKKIKKNYLSERALLGPTCQDALWSRQYGEGCQKEKIKKNTSARGPSGSNMSGCTLKSPVWRRLPKGPCMKNITAPGQWLASMSLNVKGITVSWPTWHVTSKLRRP